MSVYKKIYSFSLENKTRKMNECIEKIFSLIIYIYNLVILSNIR